MKKKTITTLATLVTAAVILLGSYISKDDKLSPTIASQDSITQSTSTQGESNQSANSQKNSAKSTKSKSSEQSMPSQSSKEQNTEELEKTTFPESIIEIQKEGIVPFGYIEADVTKVTDGDTFHIKYNNKDYKVRMLDIDTPESVKSGVEPQPYAAEASDLTKKMLTGEMVKLIFEKDTTDQFDRLLAHVVLKDDTYYNALMVQNGYAVCVFYSPNTLLKDYFSGIQNKAIGDKEGFWKLPENKRPFIEDSKGKFIASYKIKSKAA